MTDLGNILPFWRYALALVHGDDGATEKNLLLVSNEQWVQSCSTIFKEARKGTIIIRAVRAAQTKEARNWYAGEVTLDEALPLDFLQHELLVGCLDPFPIYYADPSRGGIFNAPYLRPMVDLLSDRKNSYSELPLRRGVAQSKVDEALRAIANRHRSAGSRPPEAELLAEIRETEPHATRGQLRSARRPGVVPDDWLKVGAPKKLRK